MVKGNKAEMRKFIADLFYKTPDRIIGWMGLLGILLFWLQGYSTNDGISASLFKLITSLINWHLDTIYFIKADTMPHLITSVLYWLTFLAIIWLLIKLFQKARRVEKTENEAISEQMEKLVAEIQGLREDLRKQRDGE